MIPLNQVNTSGVLLVDSALKLVYINTTAIQILAYPQSGAEVESLDGYLAEKIQRLLPEGMSSQPAAFTSGRRQYYSRIMPVVSGTRDHTKAAVVLLDRNIERLVDVTQAAIKYGFSSREQETVSCVLLGFTSREIAERMKISPSTVKTYLRHIMIKMDVSTRSGIVGKLIRASTEDIQEILQAPDS